MRIVFTMQQLQQWISKAISFNWRVVILFWLLWAGFLGMGSWLHYFGGSGHGEQYQAVARIIAGQKSGSAFLVDQKRKLAFTAAHVVDGVNRPELNFVKLNRQLSGEVVLRNQDLDFALIQLNGDVSGIPPLPVGDSDIVMEQDQVMVVGYPFGEWSITSGIISLRKNDIFRTDAASNPGNSGGPLVEKDTKRVVGIVVSSRREAQNMIYAMPINKIKKWLTEKGYDFK